MQYIRPEADGQLIFAESTEFLRIPCCLYGFHNTETTVHETVFGRRVFCYHGVLDISPEELVCPKCGSRMHVNQYPEIALWHLCIGGNLISVVFPHNQFQCPECGETHSQFISFKADGHRITEELYQYTRKDHYRGRNARRHRPRDLRHDLKGRGRRASDTENSTSIVSGIRSERDGGRVHKKLNKDLQTVSFIRRGRPEGNAAGKCSF